MVNNFNKEKFDLIFRSKRFEIENRQGKEMKELVAKLARENIRGSLANNSSNELTQNHFKKIMNIWIESMIESFGKNKILDEQIKAVKELFKNFTEHYIDREKNGFQSALISQGNTLGSSLIADNVKALTDVTQGVRFNLNYILTLAIDKHNENLSNVESFKKNIKIPSDHTGENITNKTDWLRVKTKYFWTWN